MNIYEYIKKLKQKGEYSFTLDDVVKNLQISREGSKKSISRLFKKGEIISPAKGFYIIVPPEHQVYGSIPAKDLVPLLMEHLKFDYYVGLLSAALFYGATHQKPSKFQIISNKQIKHPLYFGDIKIDIIFKKSLDKLPIIDKVVNTGYLKLASPELVALDLFNYSKRSGGVNHIATVLSELIDELNVESLVRLAENSESVYQLQRIGYVLDNIEVLNEEKKEQFLSYLSNYLKDKMKYYLPLASEVKKTGFVRCKKWKIIENVEIESDL